MGIPLPKGFYLHIHDAPTSKADLELFAWALTNSLDGEDPDVLEGYRFEGPYNQGGIRVELARAYLLKYNTPVAAQPDWYYRVPTWPATATIEGRPDDELAEYTGWIMRDNYWDSMTSVYVSPIFKSVDGYYTWPV